jgi:hypothetical protein
MIQHEDGLGLQRARWLLGSQVAARGIGMDARNRIE